jgi:hypothetical protein
MENGNAPEALALTFAPNKKFISDTIGRANMRLPPARPFRGEMKETITII